MVIQYGFEFERRTHNNVGRPRTTYAPVRWAVAKSGHNLNSRTKEVEFFECTIGKMSAVVVVRSLDDDCFSRDNIFL
jgi:hypothetical protein